MPNYLNDKKGYIKFVKEKIFSSVYHPLTELKTDAWVTSEPVPYPDRKTGRHLSLKTGDKWGKLFDCAWFNFKGTVPSSAKGKKAVLLIDIDGEACVFDRKGTPILGLTNVSPYDSLTGTSGKKVVALASKEKIDIWADAGCNDLFGGFKGGVLREAKIAVCDEELKALAYDFAVLWELFEVLPENRARTQQVLSALNTAANIMHEYTTEEAVKARAILKPELKKINGTPSLKISAIGHAHIDLAWLWPARETIRKGARTFSTALSLMDRYKDYIFGASQPQLYEWIKEYYPGLYMKIREKVKEGRWEVQGGMWVEADTNVSGGEALIRQFLFGKRFFMKEFSKDVKTLWLPDVFGYSASLPQILKKSGIDYFMTIKLSWNHFNKFPHHTFHWEGIDGSRVLAHMPPEGNYNSSGTPKAVFKTENDFMDKSISDRALLLFGIGDGGGGPGEEHLESLGREKNIDGLAPVKQEFSEKFFREIARDSAKYGSWNGELYLETHNGTFASEAYNKKMNRKMENTLRDAEMLSSISSILSGAKAYPAEQLEKIWKETLFFQFHDVLPGSSINRVYKECRTGYRNLLMGYEKMHSQSTGIIFKKLETLSARINTGDKAKPVMVFNSLSWEREEWLKINGDWTKVRVPAIGYNVIDALESCRQTADVHAGNNFLENELIRVEFSRDGSLKSVFDTSERREIVKPGCSANTLLIYQDNGNAWDIFIDYKSVAPVNFALDGRSFHVDGPKCVMTQVYKYGKSMLSQQVVLTSGSKRIDFITHVDWQETQKMLRAVFPVDIHDTEVSCDIQFGYIRRPAHTNTAWDMAKYEICCQKYMDMSEIDYGVALLNDGKYGHSASNGFLELDLLRSTTHPDTEADKGKHDFVYSLLPHKGNHVKGRVIQEAYELNFPLYCTQIKKGKGRMASEDSFFELDADNVHVETVKKAEDDNNLIVRLYEMTGAVSNAVLSTHFDFKEVWMTDMMERKIRKMATDEKSIPLVFKPFEIITLKILF